MFTIILTYRAKAGAEDAIMALQENWPFFQGPEYAGFISGDVFRDLRDARVFATVLRFIDQDAASKVMCQAGYRDWHQRLAGLTETGLTEIDGRTQVTGVMMDIVQSPVLEQGIPFARTTCKLPPPPVLHRPPHTDSQPVHHRPSGLRIPPQSRRMVQAPQAPPELNAMLGYGTSVSFPLFLSGIVERLKSTLAHGGSHHHRRQLPDSGGSMN